MSIFHSTAGRRGAALLAAAVVTTLGLAGCASTPDTSPEPGASADFGDINVQLS